MKQRLMICAALLSLIFAAHAPVLRASFVWDDTALVWRDPLIRSWRLIPEGFRHFLFIDATASNFYRPLQRLTLTADYALWGLHLEGKPAERDAFAQGYHLTNTYLHIAAALALFAL